VYCGDCDGYINLDAFTLADHDGQVVKTLVQSNHYKRSGGGAQQQQSSGDAGAGVKEKTGATAKYRDAWVVLARGHAIFRNSKVCISINQAD